MADILCGHWTRMRLGNDPNFPVRCDLEDGHEGMHKSWWRPETHETFEWTDSFERHELLPEEES